MRSMRRRLEVGWATAVALAAVRVGMAGRLVLISTGARERVFDDRVGVGVFAWRVGRGLFCVLYTIPLAVE